MSEIIRPQVMQYDTAAAWASANPAMVAAFAQPAMIHTSPSIGYGNPTEPMPLILGEVAESVIVALTESFKEQVRDALLELNEAGDLQDSQLDEILESLDLPGRKRTYTVSVKIYQEIEVKVEAASEEEAEESVDNMGAEGVLSDHGNQYDWEIEIGHVCEA